MTQRCKCEHWQFCPVCAPQMFDGNGNRLPPEPTPLEAAKSEIERLRAENERLRKFAGKVLDKSRRGFLEVSCGDIEDWAKQFGLLGLVTMSAACGDDCKCPEWVGFPLECLRPTALGSAAINAARAAEQRERREK